MKATGNAYLLTSLLLLIALQQALALGAASVQMARAQQFVTDDVTLICSGPEMKWVSISQSDAMGHFVYIDPADLDVSTPQLIDCTNSVLGDAVNDVVIDQPLFDLVFDVFSELIIKGYQSPYTAVSYLAHFVRGPPVSL